MHNVAAGKSDAHRLPPRQSLSDRHKYKHRDRKIQMHRKIQIERQRKATQRDTNTDTH